MSRKPKSESKSKAKPKLRVEVTDSLLSAVQKLAYGHDRVGALFSRIVMTMDKLDGIQFLMQCSDLEIYGEDAWIGFGYCNSDIDWFQACVVTRDVMFIKAIEQEKVKRLTGILRKADMLS
jgi:hypothetical protein